MEEKDILCMGDLFYCHCDLSTLSFASHWPFDTIMKTLINTNKVLNAGFGKTLSQTTYGKIYR